MPRGLSTSLLIVNSIVVSVFIIPSGDVQRPWVELCLLRWKVFQADSLWAKTGTWGPWGKNNFTSCIWAIVCYLFYHFWLMRGRNAEPTFIFWHCYPITWLGTIFWEWKRQVSPNWIEKIQLLIYATRSVFPLRSDHRRHPVTCNSKDPQCRNENTSQAPYLSIIERKENTAIRLTALVN